MTQVSVRQGIVYKFCLAAATTDCHPPVPMLTHLSLSLKTTEECPGAAIGLPHR